MIRVQTEDFDLNAELSSLRQGHPQAGALVSFVGLVRDLQTETLEHMTLEHYPGMTEKALLEIEQQANQRWDLLNTLIVHRVGTLNVSEQIVLVAALSPHRQDAFEACAFMMDFLKTDAPFWKKEKSDLGEQWVDARESDQTAKQQWSAKQ